MILCERREVRDEIIIWASGENGDKWLPKRRRREYQAPITIVGLYVFLVDEISNNNREVYRVRSPKMCISENIERRLDEQ